MGLILNSGCYLVHYSRRVFLRFQEIKTGLIGWGGVRVADGALKPAAIPAHHTQRAIDRYGESQDIAR